MGNTDKARGIIQNISTHDMDDMQVSYQGDLTLNGKNAK